MRMQCSACLWCPVAHLVGLAEAQCPPRPDAAADVAVGGVAARQAADSVGAGGGDPHGDEVGAVARVAGTLHGDGDERVSEGGPESRLLMDGAPAPRSPPK